MSYQSRQFAPHAALGRPGPKPARIVSSAGHMVRTCSVSNLSLSGATLRLGRGEPAESRFALLIDGEPGPRQCQLVWSSPAELGVRFLPEAEHQPARRHIGIWG